MRLQPGVQCFLLVTLTQRSFVHCTVFQTMNTIFGNGSESVPLGLFTFLTLLRMRGHHFALPGGDQMFFLKITKMQLVII